MNVIFADTLVSLPEKVKTITVQSGPPDFRFTDEEFERYCAKHADLRIEMDSEMEEYLANGPQLGWLIDPIEKKVHIYRPNLPAEILDNPMSISGDPLLKGFVLKLVCIASQNQNRTKENRPQNNLDRQSHTSPYLLFIPAALPPDVRKVSDFPWDELF